MSDELDKLKRGYQAISAPPHLATRIKACVADTNTRTGFWLPAAVACTAILAFLWVLPFTTQVGDDEAAKPTKPTRPSLSALASVKPAEPSVSRPSLSQLRSLSVPSMPTKPKLVTPPKSQTKHQIENETVKENDNAYI